MAHTRDCFLGTVPAARMADLKNALARAASIGSVGVHVHESPRDVRAELRVLGVPLLGWRTGEVDVRVDVWSDDAGSADDFTDWFLPRIAGSAMGQDRLEEAVYDYRNRVRNWCERG